MIKIETMLKWDEADSILATARTNIVVATRVSRSTIDLDEAAEIGMKESKRKLCEIVYGELETRLRGLAIAVNEMRRDAQNSREDEKLTGIANELFKLSRYSKNQLDREPGTPIQTPGS